MNLIELDIMGIADTHSHSEAYTLILSELEGIRKLPIVIGSFEAQSIAIALEENIKPNRPLTHDLIKNVLNGYDIQFKKVIIYKLEDGIFYSNIVCIKNNEEKVMDARTSDAIALAARFSAPIYIKEKILKETGIIIEYESKSTSKKDKQMPPNNKKISSKLKKTSNQKPYKSLSLDTLKSLLKGAIKSENYEIAILIRDEIESRN